MSKTQRITETMVKPAVLPPVALAPVQGAAAPAESGAKYDFGHTRRCPRCRSLQTKLRSVGGSTAWRDCQVPICRHSWKVVGRQI